MPKNAADDAPIEGEAMKKTKQELHYAYKCSGSCAAATVCVNHWECHSLNGVFFFQLNGSNKNGEEE